MVRQGGSSAGSYLADPTSPIPFHCASIVATSTVIVKIHAWTVYMLVCTVVNNDLPDLHALELLSASHCPIIPSKEALIYVLHTLPINQRPTGISAIIYNVYSVLVVLGRYTDIHIHYCFQQLQMMMTMTS